MAAMVLLCWSTLKPLGAESVKYTDKLSCIKRMLYTTKQKTKY